MVVAQMTRCRGQRRANGPPSPSSIIANVSSLAFAMSANAAEDIEHILFSGKSWQRLQANAQKDHLSAFVSAISLHTGREVRSYSSVREANSCPPRLKPIANRVLINYLLLNSRFLDLSAIGSFWHN